MANNRVYRIAQIAQDDGQAGLIPVCISTIWRWVAKGTFPQPFKLSEGVTVFDADEVDNWIAQQKDQRVVKHNPVRPTTRPDARRPGRPRRSVLLGATA